MKRRLARQHQANFYTVVNATQQMTFLTEMFFANEYSNNDED